MSKRTHIFGILGLSWMLGACMESRPSSSHFEISVSPLSLTGVVEACYDLRVTNGPAGGGETVWERQGICSSTYGDSAGGLTYIGPCDGAVATPHSVILELTELEDLTGPIAFVNPCGAPDNAPCIAQASCVPNGDTPVTFDLTVMRPATQGFFDIAVNFDDLFCSAKVDCRNDAGTGPRLLLHDPATDQRIPTVVLGFACSGGLEAATELHLGGLQLRCGANTVPLIVAGPAGNVYSASSPAPAPLTQLATYRGLEALVDGSGDSWSKRYFNVALALDFDALPGACTLEGSLSASDGPLTPAWTTPPNATYPVVRVAVPLTNSATDTGYACSTHPVGDGPEDRVWTTYATPSAPVLFDVRAFAAGNTLNVQTSAGPVVISPSTMTLTVSSTGVFSATGGVGPFTYSVVSGGGSFSGSTFTAPSTPGPVTVQVTDVLGQTSQALVTVTEGAFWVSTTPTSISWSNDGASWTPATLPSLGGRNLQAVAATTSGFVAAGTSGLVLTSPDGQTWTAVATTTPSGNHPYVVVSENTVLLAGASIASSIDGGVSWAGEFSQGTYPSISGGKYFANYWKGICPCFGAVYRSNDSVGVNAAPSNWVQVGANWSTTVYGTSVSNAGLYYYGTADGVYRSAADGSGRVALAFPGVGLNSFTDNRAVPRTIVGIGNAATAYASVDDGVTWAAYPTGVSGFAARLTWTGTRFIAPVGTSVIASTNGTTWSTVATLPVGTVGVAVDEP